MARTVADVKLRVKSILKDKTDPLRYPEADILNAINDGLVEARRVRPDLFLKQSKKFNVPVLTLDTNVLPIEDQFFNAIVYFTVGYLMLRDDEFSVDGFAAAMLGMAKAQLVAV